MTERARALAARPKPKASSHDSSRKPPPPQPTPQDTTYVKCHSAKKDDTLRLVPFAKAPPHFRPNLTPREMLLKGMHGGIYFNPKGGKPGILYPRARYPNGIPGVTIAEFPPEWFDGVPKPLYESRRYSTANNCYKVKSGLDQVGWEESGWICACDPRGWTQWYFRFFMGRRLAGGEDERQIARWNALAGQKGRWKQNLIGKCLAANRPYDDVSVSPVVRQTLLHWAYELTDADFRAGAKRVKTHGATYMPRAQLSHVMGKSGGESSGAADGPAREVGESSRSKRAKARASE